MKSCGLSQIYIASYDVLVGFYPLVVESISLCSEFYPTE